MQLAVCADYVWTLLYSRVRKCCICNMTCVTKYGTIDILGGGRWNSERAWLKNDQEHNRDQWRVFALLTVHRVLPLVALQRCTSAFSLLLFWFCSCPAISAELQSWLGLIENAHATSVPFGNTESRLPHSLRRPAHSTKLPSCVHMVLFRHCSRMSSDPRSYYRCGPSWLTSALCNSEGLLEKMRACTRCIATRFVRCCGRRTRRHRSGISEALFSAFTCLNPSPRSSTLRLLMISTSSAGTKAVIWFPLYNRMTALISRPPEDFLSMNWLKARWKSPPIYLYSLANNYDSLLTKVTCN